MYLYLYFYLKALTAITTLSLIYTIYSGEDGGEPWVLLVAGSNGWYNYRHQADVCHAYQVVREHGVPRENIILMMYDDIAHNLMNPNPGVIINAPNGSNVYVDIPKDYNGEHNRPDVFLKVLEGIDPRVGSRRVIRSGPKDRIFVYFTDHGAPGIISFGKGGVLQANQLIETIERMHARKRFNEMVLYVEACESGSMFDHLLRKGIKVYAMTAANSNEPSYACYYSQRLNTYLGDLFSVNWMEDSDLENLRKESVEMQYHKVKKETYKSHVTQFGDLSISRDTLSRFMGNKSFFHNAQKTRARDPISSREVNLDLIKKTKNALLYEFTRAKRAFVKGTFTQILEVLEERTSLRFRDIYPRQQVLFHQTDQRCYFDSISSVSKHCFNLGDHEYALKFLYLFVNMCSYRNVTSEVIDGSIVSVCKDYIDIERIV